MDSKDVLLAGYGARLTADRIAAQNQAAIAAQTREQAYHQYVAAYMSQGYSIEEAHSMVQDFFAEQERLHEQIAAASPQQVEGWSRDTVVGFCVVAGGAIFLLFLLYAMVTA